MYHFISPQNQIHMKKNVAVLGLSRLTIPQKIELGRFIVTSMTGNPNFTTPSPTLASITTNVNALETAYIAARGGGPDETSAMHARELTLEFSLNALVCYVQPIANANPANAETIILSAGMQVKKSPSPRPNGFRAAYNGNPGEVLLRTDYEKGCSFIWQRSLTPYVEESWVTMHVGTQSKFVATGLTRGTLYYFRVAKANKHGQNPWSLVVYIFAP